MTFLDWTQSYFCNFAEYKSVIRGIGFPVVALATRGRKFGCLIKDGGGVVCAGLKEGKSYKEGIIPGSQGLNILSCSNVIDEIKRINSEYEDSQGKKSEKTGKYV
ncbi:MAG: hypothetical protein R6U19_02310 [Bacteroidales bacterium]